MTRTRWMTIAAGVAASASVGLASATTWTLPGQSHGTHAPQFQMQQAHGQAHPDHTDHDHNEVVHVESKKQSTSQSTSRSSNRSVNMITIDDGDQYEVIIKDGDTVAKVNGIRVADDLVKVDGDRVIILDDDGEVIKEFNVARVPAPNAPSVRNWTSIARQPSAPDAPRWQNFFSTDEDVRAEYERAMAMERPPVMLGVLLEGPSEALQAQLGVSEYAILIEKVMEGLPADKAGLKKWDIIIEVDGDPVEKPGMLGEILMESKPGDELELTIVRGGKTIERALELAAYDAEKLNVDISVSFGGNANDARFPGRTIERNTAEAIEKAIRELEKLGGDEQAQQELREHIEQMKRGLAAPTQGLGINRFPTLDNENRLIFKPNGQNDFTNEIESRLSNLESQVDERLEDLEDQLEARWEKMEGMLDRMFDRFEQMLDESRKDRD